MGAGTGSTEAGATATRRETLQLANVLGYAAGAVSLLQCFIVASSALAHQADVVALQRGLLAYRNNNGGPWLDPQLARIAPVVVTTYLTAAIGLLVTLGLAWYAGYLTASLGGNALLAVDAGRRVAWISWCFWAVATTFSVVVLRADGTLSWAAATGVKLAATPAKQPVTGLYVWAPDFAFVALQLVSLFLQLGLGLAVGLYLGALAGEQGGARGARSAPSPSAV